MIGDVSIKVIGFWWVLPYRLDRLPLAGLRGPILVCSCVSLCVWVFFQWALRLKGRVRAQTSNYPRESNCQSITDPRHAGPFASSVLAKLFHIENLRRDKGPERCAQRPGWSYQTNREFIDRSFVYLISTREHPSFAKYIESESESDYVFMIWVNLFFSFFSFFFTKKDAISLIG